MVSSVLLLGLTCEPGRAIDSYLEEGVRHLKSDLDSAVLRVRYAFFFF